MSGTKSLNAKGSRLFQVNNILNTYQETEPPSFCATPSMPFADVQVFQVSLIDHVSNHSISKHHQPTPDRRFGDLSAVRL